MHKQLAVEVCVSLVVGIHGDSDIAHHGLGAGGGHDDLAVYKSHVS